MNSSLSGIVILTLMFAVLLLVDALVVLSWIKQSNTKYYQQANGTIELMQAVVSSQSPENNRLKIKYTFFVVGEKFTAKTIRYNIDFTVNKMDTYLKKYTNESSVDVYYNPKNPTDAVLEQGLQGKDLASPFSAILVSFNLFIFSLLMCLIRYRFRTAKIGTL